MGLVNTAIDAIITSPRTINENYKDHLIDVEKFENNINYVLNNKFSKYSNEYLYARNITYSEYFKIIFEDKLSGYNINIITDSIYEIIESRYDWSEIDFGPIGQMWLTEQLGSAPSKTYTAIIPECDLMGYSLTNVDELDLNILEICKKPSTINEVLKEIANSFDQTDLEESQDEFEELITGRIKRAITKKMMKVFQN